MSKPTKVSQFLRKAFRLIDEKRKWTTKTEARSLAGSVVKITSPVACRFCSVGAILKVAHEITPEKNKQSYDQNRLGFLAQTALTKEMHGEIDVFNDSHSYEEVTMAWKAAIRKAKKRELSRANRS